MIDRHSIDYAPAIMVLAARDIDKAIDMCRAGMDFRPVTDGEHTEHPNALFECGSFAVYLRSTPPSVPASDHDIFRLLSRT